MGRRAAFLLCCLLWAGVAHGQAGYNLGPGDRIRVTVFGHEDLSGEFEVGTGGAIAFPLLGEIAVQALTPRQVEQSLVAALQPDYLKDPRVSVEVLTYRPFYIIGEVNQPGGYPYASGLRVINAVALAGGFTYRADEDGIYITRGLGAKREEATPGTIVLPGDVIEITQRFF